jgi:hypothetical protein
MKLRIISEIENAEELSMLGQSAQQVFGASDEIPSRIRQCNKQQAEYKESTDPNAKCETCKFSSLDSCKLVEGRINPEAVCKLYKPNLSEGARLRNLLQETRVPARPPSWLARKGFTEADWNAAVVQSELNGLLKKGIDYGKVVSLMGKLKGI